VVKVKICGNQTLEDVEATSQADAQGFVVLSDTKHEIDLETAAELMAQSPLFTTCVLVTATTDPLLLSDLVEALEPDAIQVQTELSPLQMERIRRALGSGLPLYATLTIGDDDAQCHERAERMAEGPLDALLLDSRPGAADNGLNQFQRWETGARIRQALEPLPIILAGGLCLDNVQDALEIVDPYAISITSGVETADRKDPEKVKALLKQVRAFER
jgi:phosphoribosylanthranilate isomerase